MCWNLEAVLALRAKRNADRQGKASTTRLTVTLLHSTSTALRTLLNHGILL